MKHQLRSSFSTQGRRMAGARALWMANGMKKEQLSTHLHSLSRDMCICTKSDNR